MTVAIKAEGLSKEYRVGERQDRTDTLRESLMKGVGSLLTRDRTGFWSRERMWALKDVSFEIAPGEVVGIVGRNGAGKTTLLRVLSRITEPTSGLAQTRGRVGCLLEVGTGFHPELTGRDNIFLNGAILGMRRSEIARRFDEIVEFSGVEKHIDTQVKRYSSGMYVRLAFSFAAHLEPDILLVDEVLAVGDAEFQRKCLGKMQSVGESGRTVLLVSHNMPAVSRLCSRSILIGDGQLVADGDTSSVLRQYLEGVTGLVSRKSWTEPNTAPGDDLVRLRELAVVGAGGEYLDAVDVRRPVGIRFEFEVLRDGPPIVPQLMVTTEQGISAFNALDTNPRWHESTAPGAVSVTAWIPGNLLNEGMMYVSVFVSTLSSGKTIQHVRERDVVAFHVTDPVEGDSAKGNYMGQWWTGVRPLLLWTPTPELERGVEEQLTLRLPE